MKNFYQRNHLGEGGATPWVPELLDSSGHNWDFKLIPSFNPVDGRCYCFLCFPCDTEVLNPSRCTAFVDVVHEFEKMERKAPESFQ